MQSFIRRHRGPAQALRAVLIALATLAVAPGCNPDNQLPTGPRVAPPAAPQATVVGATVTVLPTLGGPYTAAYDINDVGQVVGWSVDRLANRRAFLWTAAAGMQDLGTLGGATAEATAINEVGQVVGISQLANGREHAFLWTPGRGMQDLGTLGDALSIASDINDRGEVVGYTVKQVGETFEGRALMWTSAGAMVEIGTLGGHITAAVAINNAGQVAGSGVTTTGELHPFLWTAERGLQDLGGFPGEAMQAVSMNEHGQIVGLAIVQPNGRPFIWEAGQGLRKLGALGGPDVAAVWGINDAGQVVGSYGAMPGGRHAYVWSLASGTDDLYAIAGMTEARAINNHGQVVGNNLVASLRFAAPNRAPVASPGGPYTGHKKKPVAFNGTLSSDPDGDVLTYVWDFGDGSPQVSGASPSHAYDAWGTYTVTLRVSDTAGLFDVQAAAVTIAPPGHLK